MSEYAIETEHLSRSFQALRAVDDLSLSVPAGTLFGFLGANGAGKTTTIHLLLGLLTPTAGDAQVLGFDIKKQSEAIRAQSGALLEFNGLYEHMSAEDNLDFYGRIYRMPGDKRRARIKELLTHMDLWDRRHDLVGGWSRGMKQKLAVARTLLHHPTLVFLDEPTAGLDPLASMQLNDDLVSLTRREGTTVFLNTHNLADAEKYCDQVGVIRQGKLLAQGNPDDLRLKISGPQVDIFGTAFSAELLDLLRAQPGVQDIEFHRNHLVIKLAHSNDAASYVNSLVVLITQHGGIVEEVRRGYGSLEETFATLMEEK